MQDKPRIKLKHGYKFVERRGGCAACCFFPTQDLGTPTCALQCYKRWANKEEPRPSWSGVSFKYERNYHETGL